LTTDDNVDIISNMKAIQLICTRIIYSESVFAELVLWRLPKPLDDYGGYQNHWMDLCTTSNTGLRMSYVANAFCAMNETGKGDHRHFVGEEGVYIFTTPEQLIADFQNDVERWNHENSNA